MRQMTEDQIKPLQTEYLKQLSAFDNDPAKLLDAVTRVCDDYFDGNTSFRCPLTNTLTYAFVDFRNC